MRIGIPREVKDGEFRVALTPRGVAALRDVVVEPGAGLSVGYSDAQYVAAGATLGDAWACELVVGGVLTPGQLSPKLIPRRMLTAMRPGSALVDVGIDQGGIAETSRPTSHSNPIYIEEGVVHYCVPNMPAACARSASLALEHAVLPYVRKLAAGEIDGDLATGIQVRAGKVTHQLLARDT